MKWSINSESDTKHVAEALAKALPPGSAVGLCGGLGAGKTTLVRYFVEALGGDASQVSSPTYTLEHEYEVSKELLVDHWDLYRVNGLPEELDEGPAASTIRVIEWPERCPGILSSLSIVLSLTVKSESSRELSATGTLARELLNALNAGGV